VCHAHPELSGVTPIFKALTAVKTMTSNAIDITAKLTTPRRGSVTEDYAGISFGVVLVRDEQFVRAMRTLVNVDLNPTVAP
jgi:hypothetical protein